MNKHWLTALVAGMILVGVVSAQVTQPKQYPRQPQGQNLAITPLYRAHSPKFQYGHADSLWDTLYVSPMAAITYGDKDTTCIYEVLGWDEAGVFFQVLGDSTAGWLVVHGGWANDDTTLFGRIDSIDVTANEAQWWEVQALEDTLLTHVYFEWIVTDDTAGLGTGNYDTVRAIGKFVQERE